MKSIDFVDGKTVYKDANGQPVADSKEDFLNYVSMTREEFDNLCDKFRPEHLWEKKSNRWELKITPWEYFEKNIK